MSSSSASSSSAAAPWRAPFLQHISKLSPPTFALSTIHPHPDRNHSPVPYVPRARTVVFRGMWADMPVNDKNPAPLNPSGVWESEMLSITTDARMEKVPEVVRTAPGGSEECTGSGGGGPFEAMFWVPDTNTQWRLRGKAYIVGPDIDSSAPGPSATRKALLERMRRKSDGDDAGWSWGRELTAHFGNMSPLGRGSFRNPPPGKPLSSDKGAEGQGLGQRVEDIHDEVARRNFRVAVLVPDEVDQVDLTDKERGRRWLYTFVGEGKTAGDVKADEVVAGWSITECWP